MLCSWWRVQEPWPGKKWQLQNEHWSKSPNCTCLLEDDEDNEDAWLKLLESLLSELWGMAHSTPACGLFFPLLLVILLLTFPLALTISLASILSLLPGHFLCHLLTVTTSVSIPLLSESVMHTDICLSLGQSCCGFSEAAKDSTESHVGGNSEEEKFTSGKIKIVWKRQLIQKLVSAAWQTAEENKNHNKFCIKRGIYMHQEEKNQFRSVLSTPKNVLKIHLYPQMQKRSPFPLQSWLTSRN